MKDVDPRLLVTLESVLEHGSITAAAQALGYVPSAVSQHISRLEAHLGLVLLHRTRTGVSATAHGEAVRVAATPVLAALADFSARTVELAGTTLRLDVGVFASAATGLLAPGLVELRRRHPEVSVGLRQCEPPEGLRALVTGSIDVLLAHQYQHDRSPLDSGLVVDSIGTEPMILCAGRHTNGPLDLQQSGRYDWVAGSLSTPDRRLVTRFLDDHRLSPMIRAQTDDYHVAVGFIASGLGVGLVPATLAVTAREQLRPVAVPQAPYRELLLQRRPDTASAPVMTLLQVLQAILSEGLSAAAAWQKDYHAPSTD